MNQTKFQNFMLTMLFESNGYGSSQELLEAIRAACTIDESSQWRDRKAAFNAIAQKAPLSDAYGMCITLSDVPGVLQTWCEAYAEAQVRPRPDSVSQVGALALASAALELAAQSGSATDQPQYRAALDELLLLQLKIAAHDDALDRKGVAPTGDDYNHLYELVQG